MVMDTTTGQWKAQPVSPSFPPVATATAAAPTSPGKAPSFIPSYTGYTSPGTYLFLLFLPSFPPSLLALFFLRSPHINNKHPLISQAAARKLPGRPPPAPGTRKTATTTRPSPPPRVTTNLPPTQPSPPRLCQARRPTPDGCFHFTLAHTLLASYPIPSKSSPIHALTDPHRPDPTPPQWPRPVPCSAKAPPPGRLRHPRRAPPPPPPRAP